jgi:hypothetical protein
MYRNIMMTRLLGDPIIQVTCWWWCISEKSASGGLP